MTRGIDFTERWVFLDNWTYTADLAPILGSAINASNQILLVFHGLDTVANIVSSRPLSIQLPNSHSIPDCG
jgi:hypothetical protein